MHEEKKHHGVEYLIVCSLLHVTINEHLLGELCCMKIICMYLGYCISK